MLFDAHTHINSDRYDDAGREELARAIEASDVGYVIDVGSNLEDSLLAVRDAEKYPWCYAAVGCHPHDSKDCSEEWLARFAELCKHPKVVAIGEIGLDFYYDNSERDVQRYWFRRQIRLANELGMPIVIHTRDAEQETMDILKEEGAFSKERKALFPVRVLSDGTEVPDARVQIHCFSGSAETARQYIKLGATISICGPVTYKNNRKTIEVVETTPIELMLVETDAPYLSPVPMRGKPNMAPYVEHTCRKVAEIKGLSYEDAARITCENAKRFFGIR